jgi:hypothetical protein
MKFWLKFPRKIAHPNKVVCLNKQEFINRYNMLNGIVDKLYVGLYSCLEDGSTTEVELDVIAFDIDDIDKPEQFNNLMILHNKLLDLDWKHTVMYSTKGAWIFVDCIPRKYTKNLAKGKLAAMQEKIIEGTSLYFGEAHSSPLDKAIRGDIERVVRMPTSYDLSRKKNAIFLTEEDLLKGHEHISKLSENVTKERLYMVPKFGFKIEIDPDNISAVRVNLSNIIEMPEYEYKYELPKDINEFQEIFLNNLPECIREWITNKDVATWQARAYTTLYLREKGFTINQVKSILKPFYEKMPRTDNLKNNWEHYEKVMCAELIFNRRDLKYPNCKNLWENGLCKGKCKNCKGPNECIAYR